ncbi:caspase family protein [Qipengyuania flava]|uniref:caspase family protein n=1 Tax=Qipengyuania flava TaxID=192812 RepID=UPI001C624B56|nr:caspase family protein [Qipengyuania flava]QYJ06789.1 caspase family protein [Qipengyuania flava]
MAFSRIPVLTAIAAMALGLAQAPVDAQSTDPNSSENGASDEAEPAPPRPSEAEIGIREMLQTLRDEGIDIDGRILRAREACREKAMADAPQASSDEIAEAVEDCVLVEEGVIYARAINEMNEGRVDTFNASMDQYNAQMEQYNARVAEVERQKQQYERDKAAHERLLAEGVWQEGAAPTRQTSLAAAPPPESPPAADTVPPATEPASTARVAASPPTTSSPALTRGTGGAPVRGRILSPNMGSAEQDKVQLAVMQATGPRIALVIGNEKYANSLGSLANPVNDAVLIGATLRSAGFDVEILTDASQREMKEAVQRLGNRLHAAGDNATGLFYYAGHGVQSQGGNFLIPVGSAIDSESDLELEAVKADAVLAQMEEAYVSTRIVILDACRNMPLRRRTRSGVRGLARMETPNGSFVAYSTSPGSTAADGGGIHSPFAEALASQMLIPDRPIEVTFREVRRQVVEVTGGEQVPWDSSSLLETFSFSVSR